ncbi:hypothetical protein FRZ67_06560 [Panacibacter ginsenosidivorans]|uniref:Uncharacterized protein n=1 Tax=Panacibacter ginsenosidivorans TaxID=1813871 RepID=A0A5B8V6E5_9BACT|nr:hypothetical protein [Panacibacter ginsenosidivorans]QEC66974.1 hypothetical protein FRZ67_06560 [Panacibacter ginsenosidivorans]
MRKFILVAALQLFFSIGFTQSFSIGDKIEAYNSGAWYKGSILETGTGTYAGYYKVQYDGYSQVQWIKAANIRMQQTSDANVENDKKGPRNGTYIILSYGSASNPIRIGYFELQNGKYTYYNMSKKNIGQGSFTYNAANKTVQWTSGPFKVANWSGKFEIDREGKTHKIRLNSVTIGTNSTDSN